jgi:hypothetical protein
MSTIVTQYDLLTGKSLEVPSVTGDLVSEGNATVTPSKISENVQDQLDDLRAIYPEGRPQLVQVITLLSEAAKTCAAAIEAEAQNEKFLADDCMLKIQALIGELVKLRGIGDGFGIVTTALLFTFINKGGRPFADSEMRRVLRILNLLRTAPFLSIESAADATSILEEAGLAVDPLPLTDLLTEAQEAGFVDQP